VNPPFAIPVVELVPAPWTNPLAVTYARQLMNDVGQAPITLKKEVDGFALNRLQYALLAEAYRLVEVSLLRQCACHATFLRGFISHDLQDGICSPEDVDTAVHSGLGPRWSFMGPFQTIDLNAPNGVLDYCERYSSTILGVVKAQDNTRPWKPETIQVINE
jgi:L-gulonate 3-dehydrogenase